MGLALVNAGLGFPLLHSPLGTLITQLVATGNNLEIYSGNQSCSTYREGLPLFLRGDLPRRAGAGGATPEVQCLSPEVLSGARAGTGRGERRHERSPGPQPPGSDHCFLLRGLNTFHPFPFLTGISKVIVYYSS